MLRLPLPVRALLRTPWFAVTAILTIGLGVGANAAIFSLLDRVLLRPLPYHDPDRLVWIASVNETRAQYSKSSGWDFSTWKQRPSIFEAVEAYWDRSFTLTGSQHPEALIGWQFTPTLFATLGVAPALGRTFVAGDGQPGRDAVVILSDAFWRSRFGASPQVIGSTLQLDGRDYTVVGVMPPGFNHPQPGVQLWTPAAFTNAMLEDRKQRAFRVVARLHAGVPRERAAAELRSLAEQAARDFPDTHAGWTIAVRPLRDFYTGDSARLLWILQGTAFILLMIAAANVVSLVLVRASSRERETSIRLALGAGRLALLRLHLAEGLMLAGAGGSAGLLIALWATGLLPRLLATHLRGLDIGSGASLIDGRVIAATAATALAVGFLFGVTPLLRRAGALAASLQAGSRGAVGDRRTHLVRGGVVTAQIALSVALLVGAGLLVRSFARLQALSFGFGTEGVVTAQLVLPRDRYPGTERSAAFLNQLVTGLAALPGVETAAAVNTLPLTGYNALRPHQRPGDLPAERMAEFRLVTPDYFRTMAIPLRRGRVFDDRDRLGSPDVIVVNETLARRHWPGQDPVGQTLLVPDLLTPSPKTVVGVVGDTRHHDLAREPEAEIYRPAYQAYWPFFGIVVRTQTPAGLLENSIRTVAAGVDRTVPIAAVQAFSDLAGETLAWRRASMTLMTALATAALLLTFVGVYGVMAYSVAQQSREIGVRMALGARPRDIARSVLTRGAVLTGAGIGAGLLLSSALAGTLGALLFGIPALDPVTFAAVPLVAAAASLLATAMPAAMAMRVDPNAALRGE
jgi:predicted permease